MDATQQQVLAEQLAKLREAYLARVPAELAALQALAGALQGGEGDRAGLDALHQRLHKLAGSGGTFGLAALSAAARALEQRVVTWLAGTLDGVDAAACQALVAELAERHQTWSRLRRDLRETRRRGYGVAIEEGESGVAAIAVVVHPQRDTSKPACATVSIAGPLARMGAARRAEPRATTP